MARQEPYSGGTRPPTTTPAGRGKPGQGALGATAPGSTTTDEPSSGPGIPGSAREVADQAQEKGGRVADQARQQATSRLEGGKERAVDGLGTIAQAVRQAGQELRQKEQESGAEYVDRAAERIERLAGYLRARDVGQIIDETEGFARRRPALFFGGAAVLGLLGARFLRSSGEREQAKQRYYRSLETTPQHRAPEAAPGFRFSDVDRPPSHNPATPVGSSSGPTGELPGCGPRPHGV